MQYSMKLKSHRNLIRRDRNSNETKEKRHTFLRIEIIYLTLSVGILIDNMCISRSEMCHGIPENEKTRNTENR